MIEEQILTFINENKENYIEFLRSLIKEKSYNPPGNEMNVAIKIKEYLETDGIRCDIFPFGNNRSNLVAYLHEDLSGKNLLYNGHMDVVPPGNEAEWEESPLSAHRTKTKIFGRGAADMKGPLAAMVVSLKILKQLGISIPGNLILSAVADEETGGKLGTKWLIENIFKKNNLNCQFAIIGEPSRLFPLSGSIILGEKGRLVLKIITNGISCHSSVPFLGKNAISMMSKIIENLHKIELKLKASKIITPPLTEQEILDLILPLFPDKKSRDQFLKKNQAIKNVIHSLSQFTLSLNLIHGGIKDNVIPDKCEAVMDLRLLPGQSPELTIQCVKDVIRDLGYEIHDTPNSDPEDYFVYLEVLSMSEASYWSDWMESHYLQNFKNVLDLFYEKKSHYFLFAASSDAHYLRNSDFCPQTIIFGPGNAISAHSTDESIDIRDYIEAIKVYVVFALRFLTDKLE